jgi:hypothetical protein
MTAKLHPIDADLVRGPKKRAGTLPTLLYTNSLSV